MYPRGQELQEVLPVDVEYVPDLQAISVVALGVGT